MVTELRERKRLRAELESVMGRRGLRFSKGVSYGNGAYLARQAEPALAAAGIATRIVDLRWLTAIDHDAVWITTTRFTHLVRAVQSDGREIHARIFFPARA